MSILGRVFNFFSTRRQRKWEQQKRQGYFYAMALSNDYSIDELWRVHAECSSGDNDPFDRGFVDAIFELERRN